MMDATRSLSIGAGRFGGRVVQADHLVKKNYILAHIVEDIRIS